MKNVDFRNGRPLVMMVSQYDYGYNLQVALWSNGTPVTITAAEIVSENFTTTCTFSGNVVTIPVTTSMTERFGHFPAELRVTDSLGQVSSKNFDWFVERSPLAVKRTETYSGDIVEFTAKRVPLSSVVVTMEPIQDLNGYSSPWPAGGGKNLLPLTTSGIEAANPTRTWTNHSTTINGITISIIEDANGNVDSIKLNGTATGNVQFFLTQSLSLTGNFILNGGVNGSVSVAVYGKGESTGADRAYTDDGTTRRAWIYVANGYTASNLNVKPMIRLATDTDPTYAPYSNICPISGRTGASVVVAGKNLFSKATITSGKYLDANGEIKTSSMFSYSDYIGVIGGKRYWYSGATYGFGSAPRSCFYDKDLNFLSAVRPVLASDYIDVPANATFIRMSIAVNDLNTFQLEQGTEATEYEPYKGTTYPITFTSAGTVYAGTVDLVSGVLTVTHELATYDGTTGTFTQNGSDIIALNVGQTRWQNVGSGYVPLSNQFKGIAPGASTGLSAGEMRYTLNFVNMNFRFGSDKTVAQWKTELAQQPLQVLHLLATPLTYNLTPTQVMSLLGENVVWSPDGEILVVVPEYY